MTIELWKLGAAFLLFALGTGGLVIAVVRWQLGTLTRGQEVLFTIANAHDERLRRVELALVKADFGSTVIMGGKA